MSGPATISSSAGANRSAWTQIACFPGRVWKVNRPASSVFVVYRSYRSLGVNARLTRASLTGLPSGSSTIPRTGTPLDMTKTADWLRSSFSAGTGLDGPPMSLT